MKSLIAYATEEELQTIERLVVESARPPLDHWAARYLPHYISHGLSEMHRWLVPRLTALHRQRGRRYALIAPRGGAKTTWAGKTFPLYCVVHALEPYILIISNTADQAEKILDSIKHELVANADIARDYPWAAGRGPTWSRLQIETANGICVEAVGMGMKIRGRTFGQHRPSLVICDDLENDVSVSTASQRERVFEWFHRAVLSIGNAATNILVLGTALHRDDLLQRFQKTPGWTTATFAAILNEPTRDDLWDEWTLLLNNLQDADREQTARDFFEQHREKMEAGAQLLWPEKESLYELMSLRATIGESAFQAEKQGVPTSSRSTEWPASCFDDSIWFDVWPPRHLRVMALDPSKGGSDSADYSAYVQVALGHDGLLYVDADLARRDASQIVEDGCRLIRTFRPDAIGVEANQFQAVLADEFERVSRARGLVVPIYRITNTLNKHLRIRRLTPDLHHGRLRFKANSSGARLLVDQLRDFPSGRHDDGPDALEMALRLFGHLTLQEPPDNSSPFDVVRT